MADAESLWIEHQPGVYRYLCRVVGQAETARDLTQEVFLRITRTSLPAADADGLRAWVFRIARNLALNHKRDEQRRGIPTVEVPVASAPAGQETSTALAQAIARLEPVDRDVFLLRESAGLSYDEIASACELTPDAVRSRLHRARVALRAILAPPEAAGPRLVWLGRHLSHRGRES